jgi:hypothetical protein
MPLQRGVCRYIVVIVSADGTENRGFESRLSHIETYVKR